jgi:ABC-type branched-subunit amino acid transport system substrate-binding protein
VVAQAVQATRSTNNAKIIAYLHSGVTLSSVQGPVKFDALGENGVALAYIFQWQKGTFDQVLPLGSPVQPLLTKPAWSPGT